MAGKSDQYVINTNEPLLDFLKPFPGFLIFLLACTQGKAGESISHLMKTCTLQFFSLLNKTSCRAHCDAPPGRSEVVSLFVEELFPVFCVEPCFSVGGCD